jgi:flagellar FliL protein
VLQNLFKKNAKAQAAADGETTESPDGDAAAAAEGKKPSRKLLVLGVAGAVLLLGGGGAAVMLLKPKAGAAAEKAHAKPKKKKEGEGGKKDDKSLGQVRDGPDGVTFYTLPDLLVNIQSVDGRPTFLKLKLTFEVSDSEVVELLQEDAPRLQDMFTGFLRELRPEDLAGSQGTVQLRMEILRRVNLILAPRKVDAVLIEEMLVQ